MGGVAFAFLTMAAGAAAASLDEDQAGSQDGRFGVKLFEPGREMAPDEGGMLRNFHAQSTGLDYSLSDMYYYLSAIGNENHLSAKKGFLEPLL